MAKEKLGLVYGGGDVGLMGVLARAVHSGNGHVYGVIPDMLKEREGVAYSVSDELVITRTMRERKAIMYDRADAFLMMAGGIGTLDEFMETLTLKQLGFHSKPIIILNTDQFFDPILTLFSHLEAEAFVSSTNSHLYTVADTVDEALAQIQHALQHPATTPG